MKDLKASYLVQIAEYAVQAKKRTFRRNLPLHGGSRSRSRNATTASLQRSSPSTGYARISSGSRFPIALKRPRNLMKKMGTPYGGTPSVLRLKSPDQRLKYGRSPSATCPQATRRSPVISSLTSRWEIISGGRLVGWQMVTRQIRQ